MAATMGLWEHNTGTYTAGSSGVNVIGSNIYFRSTNTASNTGTSSSDPVTKPGSGTQRSYEKYLHPRASGTFATVGNVNFYVTSTSLSTGVTIWVKTTNVNSFTTPVVPSSDTGYSTAAAAPSTNTINSGAVKDLSTVATADITSAGDVGDFLVAYAAVADTASAGTMGSTVFVIQWDET